MPQRRTDKDPKSNQLKNSRWHSVHFSGKVIMCSVLFGFLLVLVGGIVMAIGFDEDDDRKPNQYDEIQTKAPMSFVGPVIMGIGGFTVVVGVAMCTFETMCRKRDTDTRPLIKDNEESPGVAGRNIDPRSFPSTSRQSDKDQRGARKKTSPTKSKAVARKSRKNGKTESSSSSCESSVPINIATNQFLHTSDTFLTPNSSFAPEAMVVRESENQTSAMKSFMNSGTWNVSTEFQTPATSFQDSSFEAHMENNKRVSPEAINAALSKNSNNMNPDDFTVNSSSTENSSINTSHAKKLLKKSHEFLTPKNSEAESLISEKQDLENRDMLHATLRNFKHFPKNSHEFLTPKNSEAGILTSTTENIEDESTSFDTSTDENRFPKIAHEFVTPKNSDAEALAGAQDENILEDIKEDQTVSNIQTTHDHMLMNREPPENKSNLNEPDNKNTFMQNGSTAKTNTSEVVSDQSTHLDPDLCANPVTTGLKSPLVSKSLDSSPLVDFNVAKKLEYDAEVEKNDINKHITSLDNSDAHNHEKT